MGISCSRLSPASKSLSNANRANAISFIVKNRLSTRQEVLRHQHKVNKQHDEDNHEDAHDIVLDGTPSHNL